MIDPPTPRGSPPRRKRTGAVADRNKILRPDTATLLQCEKMAAVRPLLLMLRLCRMAAMEQLRSSATKDQEKVIFQHILRFLAKSSPQTPMQRLGALVVGLNTVLLTVIILSMIGDAFSDTWTRTGVASSIFGLAIILLLLPAGVVHSLAAIFPRLLDRWKSNPNLPLENFRMPFADDLRVLYLAVGWFALLCTLALFIYALMI
ncbi:hypothetical protein [Jannaschia sp. AI_61]|uniref:hypothetical protein n=1 Tax=Jannaschia sp. AI_61 TaxID=2829796 RepID=UPI001C7D5C6A|nr:hypothetical protein [Jannaschia sp. AI_61]